MNNNMYPVSSSGGQTYKRLYTGTQGDNPFFPAEQTPTADTESIDVADLNQALILSDDNQDGIVSRQELAKATLQILTAPNISQTENKISGVFSTMVLGGKDGQGLFPDMNGDGGITADELALLANGDGLSDAISFEDFRYTFEDNFNPDGTTFQLSDLEAIAAGQEPTDTQSPPTSTATVNPDQSQTVVTKVISAFTDLLQALINPPQSGQSGSGLTNAFVNFFTALTEALTQPSAQSA